MSILKEIFMWYTKSIYRIQDSFYNMYFTRRVGNSVDPDQLASQKPADLDPPCFEKKGVIFIIWFNMVTSIEQQGNLFLHLKI